MHIRDILNSVKKVPYSAFFYTPGIYPRAHSFFFRNPEQVMEAQTCEEVKELLRNADAFAESGRYMGYMVIPFEIGYCFQAKPVKRPMENMKLILFKKKDVLQVKTEDMDFQGVIGHTYTVLGEKLSVERDEYIEKIKKIKEHLSAGDTYQINYTLRKYFEFDGDVSALFLTGIFNQSARYSALVNDDYRFLLSFSPELFFETDYKWIRTKPMKGTIGRGSDEKEDRNVATFLGNDVKNRAENIMIVDLMRNDLSRISETHSVIVEKLCSVEKYETLFQMTSEIEGKLNRRSLKDIFENLFPCGSVTGAPKLRSMEIIAETEKNRRGVYTGALGFFSDERAVFNVAIRTMTIEKSSGRGEIGLGGGIVWDSKPQEEYEEMVLKGDFFRKKPFFRLLETFLLENGDYFLLECHLERLQKAASYFLFRLNMKDVSGKLRRIAEDQGREGRFRVRLTVDKWGGIITTCEPVADLGEIKVLLVEGMPGVPKKFRVHKTTYRPWDRILDYAGKNGYVEVLFHDKENGVTEGAFTNLIIKKGNRFFTPPVDLGILNGCFRRYFMKNNEVTEAKIFPEELVDSDEIYIVNSVRKLIRVDKVEVGLISK